MSNIEIATIVISCLIPIVALFIILPKLKKKKSVSVPQAEKSPVETKPIELNPEKKEEPKQVELNDETTYTADDFKSYSQDKKQKITPPKRKEELPDLKFEDYDQFKSHQRWSRTEVQKTIAEEIDSLSPELKTIIVAGVLDKKDYSDY